MIKLERIYIMDGMRIALSTEAGSVKESLALIEEAADELGAVPEGAPPSTKKKPGRKPKDEVLPPPPGTPPALPIAPATVSPAFAPPDSAPVGPGPVAALSPAPPAPPPVSSVSLAPAPSAPPSPPAPPAPPAPPSPEFAARKAVMDEYNGLIQSVPGEWQAGVRQNADNLCVQSAGGAPIGEMTQAQADAALTALKAYRAQCDAAPR